mgnify:CR=1 FL=1
MKRSVRWLLPIALVTVAAILAAPQEVWAQRVRVYAGAAVYPAYPPAVYYYRGYYGPEFYYAPDFYYSPGYYDPGAYLRIGPGQILYRGPAVVLPRLYYRDPYPLYYRYPVPYRYYYRR